METKKLWKVLLDGLMYKGEGSHARISRMVIICAILGLTIFDTIYNRSIRVELFYGWLGIIGWDGHRTTIEKKMESKKSAESAVV